VPQKNFQNISKKESSEEFGTAVVQWGSIGFDWNTRDYAYIIEHHTFGGVPLLPHAAAARRRHTPPPHATAARRRRTPPPQLK